MKHFLLLLIFWGSGTLSNAQDELFISEYIEGSSNNKAIEIYNGTGQPVDLLTEGYVLQMYFNGSNTAGLTLPLDGTLADGDVFVIAQASADPLILAQADQTNGSGWFNGDDAVVLRKGGASGTLLDVIGQIGFDPGSEWGSGLTSTQDNTLRRLAGNTEGDTNGSDVFDPAVAWEGFAQNTFDGLGAHVATSSPESVVINEVLASHSGTDNSEFIELFGSPGFTLEGLSLIIVEGDAGSSQGNIDQQLDFTSAHIIGENGYFLIGNPDGLGSVYNVTPDLSISNDYLENSSLTIALVETSSLTGNVLSGNEVVTDAVALTDGGTDDQFYLGAPVIGPDGSFFPAGATRVTEGVDTDSPSDWAINSFNLPGTNTPTPAAGEGSDGEELQFVFISEIQGTGERSPLTGQVVTIEGVVVGDFQAEDGDPFNTNLEGFFVQEEEGDYDAQVETSEGIFVYAPGAMDVSVGNGLRVTGTVTEFNGLTEITNVTAIEVVDAQKTLPQATEVLFPVADQELEHYEGMRVTFSQPLVISEYFDFDRFGELVLSLPLEDLDRPFQPTSYLDPSQAAEILSLVENRSIILDDARTVQNPDPARHPNGDVFDLENRFRGGDLLQNTTGILSYGFDAYRIQPTQGAEYIVQNPRTATPDEVGGSLKVVSFNVLNYFTTLGSRGADTQEEFERQKTKIIAALSAINADVAGLIEIENNDAALQDLVSGLNAVMGEGTYDFVETGKIGTDEIKVAFIYKPAKVELKGDFAILNSEVDPRFVDDENRPALAQTFLERATNGVLTVVVNHLKSKGSACDEGNDPYQGNCNLSRTQAAEALVDWIASDPTQSQDPDYLIIGDLNAYDEEDPIQEILAGADDVQGTADDFVDLIEKFQGEYAYSYVFDGLFGYLDYGLASRSLAEQATGATDWHINADEPDILDYDTSFKQDAQDALYEPNPYRASDHDPVIAGFALASAVCSEEPSLPRKGRSGKWIEPKIITYPVAAEPGVAQRIKLLSFTQTDELIVISKHPITEAPQDGYRYQGSEVFGEGADLGNGTYVIGQDKDWISHYTISGLEPSTRYYLAVFIYSEGEGCGPNYKPQAVAKESFMTKKAEFYERLEDWLDKLQSLVFNVYPNPVKHTLYVNIPSVETQEVEVWVSDLRGKRTSLGKYQLNAGDNKLDIDLQNLHLKKNIYVLKVAGQRQHYPVLRLFVE